MTQKVTIWDAASGKNHAQVICTSTGEVLEELSDVRVVLCQQGPEATQIRPSDGKNTVTSQDVKCVRAILHLIFG